LGSDGFVFLACELWFLSESFKENKEDVTAFQEIKTILSRIMVSVQLSLCYEYQAYHSLDCVSFSTEIVVKRFRI
jgi:hypothetical protein